MRSDGEQKNQGTGRGEVSAEVKGQGLYGLAGARGWGRGWNIYMGDCSPAIVKFIKGTCDCCADVIALLEKRKQ